MVGLGAEEIRRWGDNTEEIRRWKDDPAQLL